MSTSILIVDDDPAQRFLLRGFLTRECGFKVTEAENGKICLACLQADARGEIALVILDLHMPVMDGGETLTAIRSLYPDLPVIMLTATQDLELAVKMMRSGATDFLVKPVDTERVRVSVQNALKIGALSCEVKRLQNKEANMFGFTELIGHNGGLLEAVRIGRKAAAADIPVLISGETGTGKELFARAVHGESARAGKAFIAVNCGAIPEQLIESTLFGHEKGAFTGAVDKSLGKFREADGGTVFLDEVGELPPEAQVKLLRVLQQKEVEPVGAAGTVPVNVRIISATNRNLERDVSRGRFREDLYFRLSVLPVALPPLRERTKDIPVLLQHFLTFFSSAENKSLRSLTQNAKSLLTGYVWPGNVRQLENTIHRAVVLSDGHNLDVEDFPLPQTEERYDAAHPYDTPARYIPLFRKDGHIKIMREIEADAIELALRYLDGHVEQTAKALGIAKSTLYRKKKK